MRTTATGARIVDEALRAEPAGDEPFVFDDAAAYERMMGRWSARVAEPFLDWLALTDGLEWLDAGCGNGSFTEVLLSMRRPRSVVGIDPAPAQLAFARQRIPAAAARFLEGDAQSLPLEDASVGVAVMALVLFFLPDPARGLRELARVVRPGGTVAAYHWDMAGGGLPLKPIQDALRAEGHDSPLPPSSWAAQLDASEALWRGTGLLDVQSRQFDVSRRFGSFEDFWRVAGDSPRLRSLFASISQAARQRIVERLRTDLGVTGVEPLVMKARANAVKGRKP